MSLSKQRVKGLIRELFAYYEIDMGTVELLQLDENDDHIIMERELSYGVNKSLDIQWSLDDDWLISIPFDEKIYEVLNVIVNFFKSGDGTLPKYQFYDLVLLFHGKDLSRVKICNGKDR